MCVGGGGGAKCEKQSQHSDFIVDLSEASEG